MDMQLKVVASLAIFLSSSWKLSAKTSIMLVFCMVRRGYEFLSISCSSSLSEKMLKV